MASATLASQETLTPAEIERANLYLDQTRNGVIGAIKGLSEAQWRYKPSPDIWSIAQNMQHVTFVQERVLAILHDQLPNAPLAPEGRDCELVDAIIIHRFPNRLAKFQAPEASQPKSDRALAEELDRVAMNTRRLAESLESTPGLRQHVLEAPSLKAVSKGEHQWMDGYQWILAVSAHTERHTKQILEVRADPKFPDS
jgi:DinB superfamily